MKLFIATTVEREAL